MHEDAQFMPLKINTIVTHTKAVQCPSPSLQLAEFIQFRATHLLRQTAKFAKDL